jgi:hypothetical protein
LKHNPEYSKAVDESLALMHANIDMLKKHRGGKFLIKDLKPYVKVVETLTPSETQENTVYELHKESVRQHYNILCDLTDTIEYADEPYTEHIQTPALMEILYEKDPAFRTFVERFIKKIGDSEAIISRECSRKHSGFYGPVCVADFALTPGSTVNVLNQMLHGMTLSEKEKYYARIVLASKSWGMNTSYVFGWKYLDAMENGKNAAEAVKEEIDMLKHIFDVPVEAQNELMKEVGAFPFGIEKYQKRYMKGMRPVVEEALAKEVNYANILSVSSLSVGDIGHHLCQSTYDMYKDDYALEMLEGVVEVVEDTMKKGMPSYENLNQILSTATGASAAAVTYLLESEGFTADMAIDLMMRRFQNFIQKYPHRGVGIEFHNVDYMDVVHRGNKILHSDKGMVNKTIQVDFSPLIRRKIVRDYKGCIYPNCAINRIFSTLMRFADHFCLINIEPVTMGMMTNIIASNPKASMSPVKGCKRCSVSAAMPHRCEYCERTKAI